MPPQFEKWLRNPMHKLRLTIAIGATICLAGSTKGQDTTQELKPVPIHKAALIFPDLQKPGDTAVIELRDLGARRAESKRRKRLLPGTAGPAAKVAFVPPGKRALKPTIDDVNLSPAALNDYTILCLKDALVDRLKSRCSVSVVPDAQLAVAIKELRLHKDTMSAEDAEKLCTKLDCDAVVVAERPIITVQDGALREMNIRTELRLAALRTDAGQFVPTGKNKPKQQKTKPQRLHGPGSFMLSSGQTATRAFLKPGYSTDPAELAQLAAGDLAAQAIHTLTSGDSFPLGTPGVKVAVAPVPAPADADMFVADGTRRFTETQAIPMLSTAVSDYFRPDLQPLMHTDVVPPADVEAVLKKHGLSVLTLWKTAHDPNPDTARRIGKELKVQYLLVSRVTDIQATAYPPRPAVAGRLADEPCREAHSEAVGALIRVEDGAILWSGRGEAIVTSREVVKSDAVAKANRQTCQMAEKFALIDLKRRFWEFRQLYLQ